MLGLLNVNKPPGMTSRDVVNHVQRLVRPAKAGHAGTLDPLAVGVLVVAVGSATRLVELIQQLPKLYTAGFRLGCRSDTEDCEGQVEFLDAAPQPTRAEVEAAVPQFIGDLLQRPPVYSALKVRGRPAYARARRGESLQLAPRPIHVSRLAVRQYEYPDLVLDIDCGSGTYVRSLGRDLAETLGTGAVMTSLVRQAIGGFRLQDALALESLTPTSIADLMLPAAMALQGRTTVKLDARDVQRVLRGQFLSRPDHGLSGPIAAWDESGRLVAVLQPRGNHELRPHIVLPAGS